MKKSLIMLAVLATIGVAQADEQTFTPPTTAGLVWVVIRPDLTSTFNKNVYGIKGKIQWGGYSKTFNESKAGAYDYVLGFRHTKNDSIPLKVTTTTGKIISITQGQNPAGPYDKVISGF